MFCKEVKGEIEEVTGISTDPNGSYDFNTLDNVKEINLIEIVVPRNMGDSIENGISNIETSIAKEFFLDYR